MARQQPGPAKAEKYNYPSVYGSHASMVVCQNEDGTVTCADEFGEYKTDPKRLDNGCSDPNRYDSSRPGIRRWLGEHVPEEPH